LFALNSFEKYFIIIFIIFLLNINFFFIFFLLFGIDIFGSAHLKKTECHSARGSSLREDSLRHCFKMFDLFKMSTLIFFNDFFSMYVCVWGGACNWFFFEKSLCAGVFQIGNLSTIMENCLILHDCSEVATRFGVRTSSQTPSDLVSFVFVQEGEINSKSEERERRFSNKVHYYVKFP
jgi:hypothetical protein